jgi:hypothetical protein
MARHVGHILHHHAKRATERLASPRMVLRILGVGAGVLIILFALFLRERAQVDSMAADAPLRCAQLQFAGNRQQCEESIIRMLSAINPENSAPVCEPRERRSDYGRAASLCDRYDEMLSERMHSADLAGYGVAVWEPYAEIPNIGVLHTRTTLPAQRITLLCDRNVVDTSFDATSPAAPSTEQTLVLDKNVGGNCTLIAVTSEGSVTSSPFSLKRG